MRKNDKLIDDCCELPLRTVALSSVSDILSCESNVSDMNTIYEGINLIMTKENRINKEKINSRNCTMANRELTLEEQQIMYGMFFCQVKLYRDSDKTNKVIHTVDDTFLSMQLVMKIRKMKLQTELFEHRFLTTSQRNKLSPLTNEQQTKIFEYYSDSLHFELFKLMRERIREQLNISTLQEIEFMHISTANEVQLRSQVNLANVSHVLERCRENIEILDKKIMMLNKVTKLNLILLHQCEQELKTGVLAATMAMNPD